MPLEIFPASVFSLEASSLSQTPVSNPERLPSSDFATLASDPDLSWLNDNKVGYDGGFTIASRAPNDLGANQFAYRMRINGWGQLRLTHLESQGANKDLSQLQLKRARLVFSGSAFTPDFNYFLQLDGRSVSGDDIRLLDYYLRYDLGHHQLGLDRGKLGIITGRYKVPFNLARWLSGREFEFSDRSVSSIYFDVNRSLATGLYGQVDFGARPIEWEFAICNGLVTGGAETGSAGTLDNNYAFCGRTFRYLFDDWGDGQLADFDHHERLAARVGSGVAVSTVDRAGTTEFNSIRVVDSGIQLASILPETVDQYSISLFSVDASLKYRGFSSTLEYYFRTISGFEGASVDDNFDHGFWLQFGYFLIDSKIQLLSRWSRVQGNSGALGGAQQSAEEIALGFVWYFRRNSAKFVNDITWLDGAPINSSVLDIAPGDMGWLFRSQMQFSF